MISAPRVVLVALFMWWWVGTNQQLVSFPTPISSRHANYPTLNNTKACNGH